MNVSMLTLSFEECMVLSATPHFGVLVDLPKQLELEYVFELDCFDIVTETRLNISNEKGS